MQKSRKIALVFGTRPEIIKLSPLLRILEERKSPFFVIHTGQHYSFEMDRVFFKELRLPEPKYQLSGRSAANRHGHQTGRMMNAIEAILLKERPSWVLVQGDTNSVLAASLAAVKIPGIKLGHVEAGLRSYDRAMPEEINRILSDHASDCLFAPTALARDILLGEGVAAKKIYVTGNTIVDAVRRNLEIAMPIVNIKKGAAAKRERFFLMTLHRPENVDNRRRLSLILEGVRRTARFFGRKVVFPMHPRTSRRLKEFHLLLPVEVVPARPAGFLEFLRLEEMADLILSDSGGVQEEACILKTPCVTLRTSTERPETVKVGANWVSGYEPVSILRASQRMLSRKTCWRNPFGDGHSAERILKIMERFRS